MWLMIVLFSYTYKLKRGCHLYIFNVMTGIETKNEAGASFFAFIY